MVTATGKRPAPSRTRKLSLTAPMVLHPPGCGRVGHHRAYLERTSPRLYEEPGAGSFPTDQQPTLDERGQQVRLCRVLTFCHGINKGLSCRTGVERVPGEVLHPDRAIADGDARATGRLAGHAGGDSATPSSRRTRPVSSSAVVTSKLASRRMVRGHSPAAGHADGAARPALTADRSTPRAPRSQ